MVDEMSPPMPSLILSKTSTSTLSESTNSLFKDDSLKKFIQDDLMKNRTDPNDHNHNNQSYSSNSIDETDYTTLDNIDILDRLDILNHLHRIGATPLIS